MKSDFKFYGLRPIDLRYVYVGAKFLVYSIFCFFIRDIKVGNVLCGRRLYILFIPFLW